VTVTLSTAPDAGPHDVIAQRQPGHPLQCPATSPTHDSRSERPAQPRSSVAPHAGRSGRRLELVEEPRSEPSRGGRTSRRGDLRMPGLAAATAARVHEPAAEANKSPPDPHGLPPAPQQLPPQLATSPASRPVGAFPPVRAPGGVHERIASTCLRFRGGRSSTGPAWHSAPQADARPLIRAPRYRTSGRR